MPNWCYNRLTVEGPPNYRRAFLAAIEGEESILASLYPIAEPGNWYEWCIEHWGTKWPESDLEGPFGEPTVEFTFSTAWAPPVAGIAYISGMFPALTFTLSYDEEGMAFLGAALFRHGEVIAESMPDYPTCSCSEDDDECGDACYEELRELVYETLDNAVCECYAAASTQGGN